MNDEDKKYLRKTKEMRPSFKIFNEMAQILKNTHENTDKLLSKLNDSLSETLKTVS